MWMGLCPQDHLSAGPREAVPQAVFICRLALVWGSSGHSHLL